MDLATMYAVNLSRRDKSSLGDLHELDKLDAPHDAALSIALTSSWNTTVPDDLPYDMHEEPSMPFAVLKFVIMLTLIASTLLGNALVILSVYRSSRLRIIANSFIVSLAVADFMMALLVMPFSATQNVTGRWYFGSVVCDVFNANDVLFSTSSLLHLCCIAVDRYIAITVPFRYASLMTPRTVTGMLSAAWGASVLLSHGPIHLGWYTTSEYQDRSDVEVCTFEVNQVYGLISCTVSFWTPAVVIVIAYFRIYRAAKKQENMIYSLTYSVGQCVIGLNHVNYIAVRKCDPLIPCPAVKPAQPSRRRIRSEHKAAKTLGVILGAFLACWVPFFTWYLTTTFCSVSCYTPPDLVSALFWIGYSNSALNPVIYAFFNKDFRKAFVQILGCNRLDKTSVIHSRSVRA